MADPQFDQWRMANALPLFVTDGERELEYRLTFKTLSAFDMAKFRARRNKIFSIIEAKYGEVAPAAGVAARTPEQAEDADALFDILFRHAIVMAALALVELKDGDAWASARLPDTWYDAEQFAFNGPASILDQLVAGALDAGNPMRLFSFLPITDDEKKMMRLTVQPSAS